VKISVITACYNAENTIEETLKSVEKQTYKDVEYIVIDGNSTDKTLEIVDKYKNSVTKLVSEKDTGVYNAMNKGISFAAGDLLFFLNADDVFINENVLENFASFANKTKSGILLGNILLLNRYTGENYFEKQSFIDNFQLINSTIFHPATFFRREVFEKYGTYNENNKIVSDYEWYVNYFRNGGNYSYFDVPVSVFSLGGLSSDEKHHQIHLQERENVINKYFSKNEINSVLFFSKYLPRRSKKIKFRQKLAKLGLNKIYKEAE